MATNTEISEIILASRSPRRRELLESALPGISVRVVPPANSDEAGFEGLDQMQSIVHRLKSIAVSKYETVRRQLSSERSAARSVILSADTAIVAGEENLAVLGQPPETDAFAETVKMWFEHLLIGRSHLAMTAVCAGDGQSFPRCRIVETRVTFRRGTERLIEWYLRTGEPRGKAGGYALQGAGSVFVKSVDGSPSNVIGLPLNETLELLKTFGIDA